MGPVKNTFAFVGVEIDAAHGLGKTRGETLPAAAPRNDG